MENNFLHKIPYSFEEQKGEIVLSFLYEKDYATIFKKSKDYISENEIFDFKKLKTTNAQHSFLVGKFSAKKAISLLNNVAVKKIFISHGVFGQPIVNLHTKISISHTVKAAFSIAFNETILIGCDIEKIKKSNLKTIALVLEKDENLIKTTIPTIIKSHIIWSAKESLSKAISTGFLAPINLFEVENIKTLNDCYEITFKHFNMFKGISFVKNNYLFTLVFPKKTTINTSFIKKV